ncbi:hypothetical protein [Streptomyces acidiscabies]|uniref:hypothetical protein n=1 Tax=Streptomyces acidiscabies TaxID=42234 RepID=UPI002FF0D072
MTVPHRLPAAEHHQDTVVVEHGMVIEQMADQVAELVCQLVDAAEVEGEPGWSDLAVADAVGAIDRLSEVLRAARPELRDVLGPVRRAAAEALTLLEGEDQEQKAAEVVPAEAARSRRRGLGPRGKDLGGLRAV